ncbi:hypothetical protein N493_19960 (plasmid) [Clostridium botulinum B2 433]|uniref:hypothetical protein n=1 Tax=Clostridium botulinum TaxID=1491 RepID=UPI0007E164DA|nr:hypothetical protein [Clostridium botulinum]KEI84160.1 hypothetical protein N493_19960 [Clostridium botulinum B2 433]
MKNKHYVRESKRTNLRKILGFINSITFLKMLEKKGNFEIIQWLNELGMDLKESEDNIIFEYKKGTIIFEKLKWYDDLNSHLPTYTEWSYKCCKLK